MKVTVKASRLGLPRRRTLCRENARPLSVSSRQAAQGAFPGMSGVVRWPQKVLAPAACRGTPALQLFAGLR